MFDRFKKSAEPRPNQTPDEARPSPSGFGRRQTPVGQNPVGGSPAMDAAPSPPSGGFGRRATTAAGCGEPPSSSGQDLKKLSQAGARIAEHLMRAYRDSRGVHVETIVGAAAVLAGEFALRASTPLLPDSGWIAGAPADALMYAGSERIPITMWSIVQVVVHGLGVDAAQLPNVKAIAMRASENLGAPSFPPKLSVPVEHYPHEFSPNAGPRFRNEVMAIAREAGLNPTEIALALAFTLGLLIKNAHTVVPAPILTLLAAELMIATPRMAPLKEPIGMGSSAPSDTPPPAVAPGGFGQRQVSSAQSAAASGSDLPQRPSGSRDLTQPILAWLTAELGDGSGGIHCETAIVVLGALAGFAAQQAVWAGMAELGTPQHLVFKTVRTNSGETFYLSDLVNEILAGKKGEAPTIVSLVAVAATKAGGRNFPDLKGIFRNSMETMGSALFGRPRIPAGHAPRILPRDALTRYWRTAHSLVEGENPPMKARWFALAAGALLQKMQHTCPPDIAFALMMEAAVPMSKIDPATVPK